MRNRRRTGALLLLLLVGLTAGCGTGSQPPGFSAGRSIYGDKCSACHGAAGGGGVGPALDAVIETWPRCSDQIEWISLGSDSWRTEYGDLYGATSKPVTGGMPGHMGSLTQEEIALVAAFERAQYGGSDPETALEQCGAG